eukprot:SM000112S23967  [mRNA]  locus=s112:20452:21462:- [translate_table: standard]
MAAGGTTLSALYSAARHATLELREGLERLERLEAASASSTAGGAPADGQALSPRAADLTQGLRLRLAELARTAAEMDRMWRSQPSKPQRDLWRRKVEQVAEESDDLRRGFDKYLRREHRRQADASDRAELLHRRAEGARVLEDFDEEMQSLQSARNSSRLLDEAYATGAAVLGQFAEQRDRLKAAQRKALDVLNTVGLSAVVLRAIDRRQWTDKMIAYAGMIVTLVVVFVVWRYTR